MAIEIPGHSYHYYSHIVGVVGRMEASTDHRLLTIFYPAQIKGSLQRSGEHMLEHAFLPASWKTLRPGP